MASGLCARSHKEDGAANGVERWIQTANTHDFNRYYGAAAAPVAIQIHSGKEPFHNMLIRSITFLKTSPAVLITIRPCESKSISFS